MGKGVKYELIPLVNATDFSDEVLDYCSENEISTHYNDDIAFIKDNGNVFAEWLKENNIPKVKHEILKTKDGKEFRQPWYDWVVAISST